MHPFKPVTVGGRLDSGLWTLRKPILALVSNRISGPERQVLALGEV